MTRARLNCSLIVINSNNTVLFICKSLTNKYLLLLLLITVCVPHEWMRYKMNVVVVGMKCV